MHSEALHIYRQKLQLRPSSWSMATSHVEHLTE